MGTFHRFLYRLVVYTEYNLYTFSRCFYFFYAAMPKGVRHHGECRPRRRRRRKRGASRLLLDSKRDVRVCVCVRWIGLVIPSKEQRVGDRVPSASVPLTTHSTAIWGSPFLLLFIYKLSRRLLFLLLILFMNFFLAAAASNQLYIITTHTHIY